MALIPPSRLTNWTPGTHTGVIGGIPTTRSNIVNVVGLAAGEENDVANTALIQGAIDGASTDDIVLIPSGTWYYSGLNLGTKAITVRGAGMDTTTLITTGNGAVYAGSNVEPVLGGLDTSGTLAKGDDGVTLADTSAFTVGQMILLQAETLYDDTAIEAGATLVYQVRPLDEYVRKQMSRVTAKDSTTVTFFPPLHFDCTGQDVKVTVFQNANYGAALEDLTLDCSESEVQNAILFQQCYGSWIKNVKVTQTFNYAFFFTNCLNCEVRESYANERKPGGSNGAGFLWNTNGNCLIEDNIITKFNPGVEVNFSSTGNVFAYNYIDNPRPTAGINTNHSPHNSFNLFEGNISPNTQCDGYYGSTSEDTHYRNWYTGLNVGDGIPDSPYEDDLQVFIIAANRFTRKYSYVGNVMGNPAWPYGVTPYSFGNPNIGNSSFDGTAQPSIGDFWVDWKATGTLTTRADDTHGTITLDGDAYIEPGYNGVFFRAAGSGLAGNSVMVYLSISVVGNQVSFTSIGAVLPALSSPMEVFCGENGFQEQDRDVFWVDAEYPGTTILRGNYLNWAAGGNAIPAGEAIGEDEFPDSLFREEAPAFFGALPWPPVDPLNPETLNYGSLPASQRFLDGLPPSAPEILNSPDQTAFLGETFSIQILTFPTADEGYTADDLPEWADLDAETGLITGTPVAGEFEFELHATNATGTGDLPMTLTVRETRRAAITAVTRGIRHSLTKQGPFIVLAES